MEHWTDDVYGVSDRPSLDYIWLQSKDTSSFRYVAKDHGYSDDEIEDFIDQHITLHPIATGAINKIIRRHRKRT
jgi:hypothetical protein